VRITSSSALLAADQVLPAAAAHHRKVGDLEVPHVREVREQSRVLVVGVRGDVQHARGRAEPIDRMRE
jgi:hypothetical protein